MDHITARELKNAYQRAWNAKNPDRLKEYRQKYWKKKAEALNKSGNNQLGASKT